MRFYLAAVILVLACTYTAEAQQTKKVPRIGVLMAGTLASTAPFNDAFRQGLGRLGYIEGRTIAVERRFAEGNFDKLPGLAAELVRLKMDVMVAAGSATIGAAQQATRRIPIVMAFSGDPVRSGFVDSLARPGKNITGLSEWAPEIPRKQLEILKEAVPDLSRVAVLRDPRNPTAPLYAKETEVAAKALGIATQFLEAQDPDDLESAFKAATRAGAKALYALPSGFFNFHQARIVDFATKNRLPTMFVEKTFVDSGGLLSYGPDYADLWRRAAIYVDKILQGARPSEMAVEPPTKFELAVNLKTAKQVRVTIPSGMLARANKIIK